MWNRLFSRDSLLLNRLVGIRNCLCCSLCHCYCARLVGKPFPKNVRTDHWLVQINEIYGAERSSELEKSKESRFWLMASEHSTSCLVDRDTLLITMRSTNDAVGRVRSILEPTTQAFVDTPNIQGRAISMPFD
jgi:hypothetical protein